MPLIVLGPLFSYDDSLKSFEGPGTPCLIHPTSIRGCLVFVSCSCVFSFGWFKQPAVELRQQTVEL